MKKKCIMALIIGAAFLAQGCGYEEGTDAVVTVVDSTPTPEPTEKPKATATRQQQIPQQTEQQRQRIPRQMEQQRRQTLPQPGQQIPQHRQQLRSRPQAASTYRLRMPPIMQWRV